MGYDSADETVRKYKLLEEKLAPLMPERINKSSMYVDMADIYGICRWYVDKIDEFTGEQGGERELAYDLFIEIETQILRHFSHHMNLLKKTLPRAIKSLGE